MGKYSLPFMGVEISSGDSGDSSDESESADEMDNEHKTEAEECAEQILQDIKDGDAKSLALSLIEFAKCRY